MFELCSLSCLKLYSMSFAIAHAQKRLLCLSEFAILVLHYYTRNLFYHLKQAQKSISNLSNLWKKENVSLWQKQIGNIINYINITFPDWVIVENIILRNVIITFPEMIFSTITQSENVICILLYRVLDPLFSIVLGLPWWGEFQRENDAQPLIYMHERKKSFTKMFKSSLNARTGRDVRSNKLRHDKSTTPNLIPSSAI